MFNWINQHDQAQQVKRQLALEDQRMIGAASLLSLDMIYDTGNGRDTAIKDLADIRTRYQLEPEDIAFMLLKLEPDLAETLVS